MILTVCVDGGDNGIFDDAVIELSTPVIEPHIHTRVDADFTSPETSIECKETEGKPSSNPNEQGNTAGNILNNGYATIQGEWIYYVGSAVKLRP